MDKGISPECIEADYVHKVYEDIADQFSHTRYQQWPRVRIFIQENLKKLTQGGIIVDCGCGNGKYSTAIRPEKKDFWFGNDYSMNLLSAGRRLTSGQKLPFKTPLFVQQGLTMKPVEMGRMDLQKLALRDKIADLTISIAVIHHFASRDRRVEAIRELLRITKLGGKVLIYVWARHHGESTVGSRKFESCDGK